MNKKLFIVAHKDHGTVVTPFEGQEDKDEAEQYAAIRVEGLSMSNGAIKKTSALIRGTVEVLSMAFPNLKAGDKINGRIAVRESNEPFWEGQNPVMNPETDEVVSKNGKPLYRNTVAITDSNDESPDYQWVNNSQEEVEEVQKAEAGNPAVEGV